MDEQWVERVDEDDLEKLCKNVSSQQAALVLWPCVKLSISEHRAAKWVVKHLIPESLYVERFSMEALDIYR